MTLHDAINIYVAHPVWTWVVFLAAVGAIQGTIDGIKGQD